MNKKLKNLSSIVNFAEKKLSEGASEVSRTFKESGIEGKLTEANKAFRESEFGKRASSLSDGASDVLDEVSGKKILALVEERMVLQEKYNDLLAEKLDEALDRIQEIEKKIGNG